MQKIEAFYDREISQVNFRMISAKAEALGPRDLRVNVHAISVNPVDFKVASSLSKHIAF